MPNLSPYERIAAEHPQFRRRFRERVQRGDTLADLAFWVRTRYGVRVSHETIRRWRSVYGNGNNGHG